MTAIKINPIVVSVSPTIATPITPINPTQHGGGFKKLIAVVAAVVIPIAAPAIASAIGVSGAIAAAGASATVASTVGSAIVGAGLGAVSAKVTGGDVKTGALMGAIGGGIGGYSSATKAAAAAAEAPAATEALATGADAGLSATPAVATDVVTATPAVATNTLVDAVSATPVVSSVAENVVKETATKTLGESLMSGAKAVGSAVVDAVTNPENLASITLQAGAQLVGAALAPDPEMPPETKELIELRKAELAQLKEKDEQAFNAQMEASEQFLRQADQYNPVYMAFQAANKAAIDSQRKLREQERKYALASGRELSPAERRRMQLDAARNVSSSYDQGFQQGLTSQNKVTQAGLQAIPNASSYAAYNAALTGLSDDVQTAEEAALLKSSTAAKNISDLFAGFDTSRAKTDEEEDAISKTNNMASSIDKSSGVVGLNKKNAPKEINQGFMV